MVKAGSHCCKLLLKTTEEDQKEVEEGTVSLAAAKETSMNYQNWMAFSNLKRLRKTSQKAFLNGHYASAKEFSEYTSISNCLKHIWLVYLFRNIGLITFTPAISTKSISWRFLVIGLCQQTLRACSGTLPMVIPGPSHLPGSASEHKNPNWTLTSGKRRASQPGPVSSWSPKT